MNLIFLTRNHTQEIPFIEVTRTPIPVPPASNHLTMYGLDYMRVATVQGKQGI